MNINRKASTLKQEKRLTEAYSGIFRGLYWRHEFARRNEAVSNASRTLAKALGFKPTRFEEFIRDAHPLTDELVHVCRSGTSPEKTALREFLDKYKVLPTTWSHQGESTYFPMEFGLGEIERENYVFDTLLDCRTLFNSFLLFEACVMTDLGMGRPVMFPLMPLMVFGKNIDQRHLDDSQAPVLINRFAPIELIGHYSDALDNETDMTQRDKESAPKRERIPWESFPSFIDIHDDPRKVKENEMPSAFKIDYYAKHIEPPRTKPVKDYAANAIASYNSLFNAAIYYRDNYTVIL